MVRGKENAWDPQICLSWGERFLTWIKRNVESSGTAAPGSSVWRVKFTPGVGVELALLSEEERREVEAGEDRVGFLPRWYHTAEIQDVSSPSAQRGASAAEPERQSRSSAPSAGTTLPAGWQI
jgi:RAT1-interacting protein